MADEEKRFTSQDVNNLVQKRLDRLKSKYSDYEALKAELEEIREDHASLKAENTSLKGELAERDGKLREAQKAEIAKKAGLSEAMADRLQGETKEELEADAKALAEAMGPGPSVGTGTNPPTPLTVKPYTRADIKAMKPEEITANWDQISAQLKDGSLNRV